MNSLITLAGMPANTLDSLTLRAVELYRDRSAHQRPLAGSIAGMLFLATSTRTRTAFTTGAMRLGADVISYGPADLQLNTGEGPADTGRILASMLDLLVVRVNAPSAVLHELGHDGRLPVVNAMTSDQHPTQAITDLATLQLLHGELAGLRLLYIGEGNNSAVALALALARVPRSQAIFWTPAGFGLPPELVEQCRREGSRAGATLLEVSHPDQVPADIDVVYTTRWQTTGTQKPDVSWREVFRPLHIDATLMARWPAAVVMHDLPAHRGEEISGEVLDGERSIAWTQAAMKLPAAMAVLEAVQHR